MSNFLETGSVLPSGLLGSNFDSAMAGFNKTYKNTTLRMGIATNIYPVGDPNNHSGLTTEYDVLVLEQNEDKGATSIKYRNCIAAEDGGSIADYLEKTIRILKNKTSKGALDIKGQDGAIVLIQCLDGMSDKAIITSFITHPDRKTKLVDSSPRLAGAYNGVNILVNPDGSTSLVFNGATNNSGGVITSPTGGPTTVQIQPDGSFQVSHSTVTFSLSKSGAVTITTTGNVNVTAGGNTNVNATNATVTAKQTATIDGQSILLGANAVEAVVKGTTFAKIFNQHTHIGNLGANVSPPLTPMDSSLSTIVKTE